MSIDDAIVQVESGGNDAAIGDLNIPDHAYGPMQIRQPVCDDLNKFFGTKFKAQDFQNRLALSKGAFWLYMSIYCTSKQLGRTPTDQDRARIWNGGPAGWKSQATLGYWQKVQKFLG